ncbi:MAG: aldehyde dehydrogenase family protein [Deltaproteobacteria bacterium]|nr:aldehyde dehydrogenase family protein [Deltaproteobacteria bacterium]
MDAALRALVARKDAWATLHPLDRVDLLERTRVTTWEAANALVDDAIGAKGALRGGQAEAEEWLAGPYAVLRNLRLLARSLREISRYGAPRPPGRPHANAAGRVVVRVFPADNYDRVLFSGYSADVTMAPDVTLEGFTSAQAGAYHAQRRNEARGEVALVLAAGNVSSIGPMDALHVLFAENAVVLLKTNPANPYVGRFVERAFAPLIEAGALRVVHGGADEGAWLAAHPAIDRIHVTGSDRTHDAIVFGAGDEGARAKAAGERRNPRPITSELGNVSPIVVVPGPWTDADLAAQGLNIASALANNAGFNCVSARVIVQSARWEQRVALLDAVRGQLALAPTRAAWYPGAEARHAEFVAAHPEAERFGHAAEGELPWTLVAGVDPAAEDEICFQREAFCALMAETALPAEGPVAFLDAATRFCNERLWGTLAATIVIHPASLREPGVADALERAIDGLRYGTVVVNHFPGLAYALTTTPWGGAPGQPATDIQSGRGFVHNTLLLDHPEKTVVRGPFRPFPKPPWWLGHKRALDVARGLVDLEAEPSLWKLARVVRAGLRG